MRPFILSLAAVAAFVPAAHAQTIAITGGKVYTVSGATIDNGTVIIRDGKITAVGPNVAIPDGAQRIDASGKWVTPGLVDAATVLGLSEISAIPGTNDAKAEGQDIVAAAFKVADGLNPTSILLSPTREDGITTVVIHPDNGLLAGQSAVVELVDGSATDMILKPSVAMVANFDSQRRVGVA